MMMKPAFPGLKILMRFMRVKHVPKCPEFGLILTCLSFNKIPKIFNKIRMQGPIFELVEQHHSFPGFIRTNVGVLHELFQTLLEILGCPQLFAWLDLRSDHTE